MRAAPATTATKLLLNLSDPSQIERAAALPVDGVGLLRAELMVLEVLGGSHPRLLIEAGRGEEFVARMAAALQAFAAGFAPRPITYRTIDFRTNEFRGLQGGDRFEPVEANPMIGFRGALRYTRDPEVFRLELAALTRVWDTGHTNLHVMLPFARTARELGRCRELIARVGAARPARLWLHLQTSICGQAPSVYPEYTDLLVRAGIDAISVTMDAVDRTRGLVAAAEQRILLSAARRGDHSNEEARHGARVHRRL